MGASTNGEGNDKFSLCSKTNKPTTTITKKRHLPGGESFEGSGGQHPDPEAISLPVGRRQFRRRHYRRRHYRRRHIRFSPTTPMHRGGVCEALASGFSASAKSR